MGRIPKVFALVLGFALGSEVILHHSNIAHFYAPSSPTLVDWVQHNSEAAPEYTTPLPGVEVYAFPILDSSEIRGETYAGLPPLDPFPTWRLRTTILLC